MYEFLDRLVSVALPRIRDFRGISGKAFDGRGNYNLGVKEQIIFPEIEYDKIDALRGMNISITTTAKTDEEPKRFSPPSNSPSRTEGTMAKLALKNREAKRAKTVAKYAAKRAAARHYQQCQALRRGAHGGAAQVPAAAPQCQPCAATQSLRTDRPSRAAISASSACAASSCVKLRCGEKCRA
jgi:hypothetical protein